MICSQAEGMSHAWICFLFRCFEVRDLEPRVAASLVDVRGRWRLNGSRWVGGKGEDRQGISQREGRVHSRTTTHQKIPNLDNRTE
jgi:hypothetical protein